MKVPAIFLLLLGVLALSACATVPTGPTVMVWPGPGKPFEVFQSDDEVCRQWASQQVGTQPTETANKTLAGGAAAGAILGAGLGAAFGGHHPGPAIGFGAASGAVVGAAAASGPASAAQNEAQRRYDNAYLQCMYFKGNQVPGIAVPHRRAVPAPPPPTPPPGYAPPPSGGYPPPPPGAYPPPPPSQ